MEEDCKMKTFKQFTTNGSGYSEQELLGHCSAGGPPNQKLISEAVRTRRINDSGSILTDPAADNTGLGHPDNHYSKIVSKPADSDDERPDVEPHLTNQQAHHFRALASITQHNHPDYRSIVPNYTNGSTDLNEHLYQRYKQGKRPNSVVQGINIAKLDNLIKTHKTPHAMTVYTGPHFNPHEHAGKETTLPAFNSFSLSPHVAKDFGKWEKKSFANKDPESHRHILRVHLPEGHPHLFTGNGSVYQGQGELILPRQTKIHIAEKPSHIVRGNFHEHFTDTPDVYNHVVHFWDAHIVH